MVDQQPLFTALADPMRRHLLINLAASSPKTATQLATEYPLTRQGILKHLSILEGAGLVAVTHHGREKRYTLLPEPLTIVQQWLDSTRALWDGRLARLKRLLEADDT